MTTKGRKRHPEPWREVLLDELTDESEDERRDFRDIERDPFESEHGPAMGNDGDDNPEYAQPKAKFDGEKLDRGDINDPVRVNPKRNPAGEIVEAGHGFVVRDPRSRPWKTAPRAGCAHCGGPMPPPSVSDPKYLCEFDPDASAVALALIGEGQPKDEADFRWDKVRQMLGTDKPCRHGDGCRCGLRGCKCSGCILRQQVLKGRERNRGHPRKVCSDECGRLRGNERSRWKRAVKKAEEAGVAAPDEPEDKGLKLMLRNGPCSGFEGNGSRYTAATDTGLWAGAPRA